MLLHRGTLSACLTEDTILTSENMALIVTVLADRITIRALDFQLFQFVHHSTINFPLLIFFFAIRSGTD